MYGKFCPRNILRSVTASQRDCGGHCRGSPLIRSSLGPSRENGSIMSCFFQQPGSIHSFQMNSPLYVLPEIEQDCISLSACSSSLGLGYNFATLYTWFRWSRLCILSCKVRCLGSNSILVIMFSTSPLPLLRPIVGSQCRWVCKGMDD